MLVHLVLFSLKKDLTTDERAAFFAGLETLKGIEAAQQVLVGTPAATADRPAIDKDYDAALTILLADVAAHDAYQAHSLHGAFIETFKTYWENVRIIDAD